MRESLNNTRSMTKEKYKEGKEKVFEEM